VPSGGGAGIVAETACAPQRTSKYTFPAPADGRTPGKLTAPPAGLFPTAAAMAALH